MAWTSKPYRGGTVILDLPPGIEVCPHCEGHRGETEVRFLDGLDDHSPNEKIKIHCLCDGVMCQFCQQHPVHKPVSNSYDPMSNTIHHWPWFTAMMKCDSCRKRDQSTVDFI